MKHKHKQNPNDGIVEVTSDPVGAEDFVLFVLPMEPPHTLIKIHKPERGAETTDGVLIGEFTYKVIP